MRRSFLLFYLAGFFSCSDPIPLIPPEDLKIKQIGYGTLGAIELSWKLIMQVDAYRIYYDEDQSGPPYQGKSLSLVQWTGGCYAPQDSTRQSSSNGDMGSIQDIEMDQLITSDLKHDNQDFQRSDYSAEAGVKADIGIRDLGQRDSPWPGVNVDSPIFIPGAWCLERENAYDEAGIQPQETPAKRPRIRLQNMGAGKTYYFVVLPIKGSDENAYSTEVSITMLKEKAK